MIRVLILILLLSVAFYPVSSVTHSQPPALHGETYARSNVNVKNNWLVAHLAFTATYEYAVKHHNRYPRAYRWEEEIKPYWIKTVPFDVTLFNRENLPYRLAMNAQLSAKKMDSFDDNMPLFYGLLSTKSNAHGLPIDVSNEPGRERPVIVYVDGHSFGE